MPATVTPGARPMVPAIGGMQVGVEHTRGKLNY